MGPMETALTVTGVGVSQEAHCSFGRFDSRKFSNLFSGDMMKTFQSAMCFVAVLLMSTAAQAVTVTNVTNDNAVLFSDDFENVLAVSTVPAYDASGFYHPVATVGTWSFGDGNERNTDQVTNSTASPDPGPSQGKNYMRMYFSSARPENGLVGALESVQSHADDVIKLSTMVYIPKAKDAVASIQLGLSGTGVLASYGTDSRVWVRPGGAGTVECVTTNGGLVVSDTGVHYQAGKWQRWDIEYAVGSATFTLSVDGETKKGLLANPGNVGGVWAINGNNPDGSVYLDGVSVPKPATTEK